MSVSKVRFSGSKNNFHIFINGIDFAPFVKDYKVESASKPGAAIVTLSINANVEYGDAEDGKEEKEGTQ